MIRKNINEHAFQEGELVETWSKPRIFVAAGIFIAVLCAGIYGYTVLAENHTQPSQDNSILGITDSSAPKKASLPTTEDISNILDQAKENLSQITTENIISSQAAIQKIIQDLQGLQNGSGSAVGVFCDLVCKK